MTDKPKGRPRGRSGGRKKGIGNDGGPSRVLAQIRIHPEIDALIRSEPGKSPGDVIEDVFDEARPGWRNKKNEPG